MTRQEYQELLSFKEERINHWEEYGQLISNDDMNDDYPDLEVGI